MRSICNVLGQKTIAVDSAPVGAVEVEVVVEDAVEAVAAGATTKRFGCRSRNLDEWLKMVRFYR